MKKQDEIMVFLVKFSTELKSLHLGFLMERPRSRVSLDSMPATLFAVKSRETSMLIDGSSTVLQ